MFTSDQVRNLIRDSGAKQQWHADGRSLYLVTKGGRGFWVLHFRDPRESGAIRNTGLGSADALTPAAARKKRDGFMVALSEGRPVALMTRKTRGELFSTAADAYLSNHADEWNERTRKANTALVANKVPAEFKARAVTAITPDQVADVLRPIWNGPGANAGSRLRQLIEGILRSRDVTPNPAAWERLQDRLSRKRAEVKHHDAMPFADVPEFIAGLSNSIEDRAGLFVILTAVRRKEALAATWGEFDLKARIWNIPAERMKSRKAHSVPLSQAAIDALGKPGEASAYVFTNAAGGPLSDSHAALDKTWLPNGYTLHGFRSSFSQWAEAQDHGRRFAPSVIEAALAHAKGNAVTQAYLRSDLFEARRDLMDIWAKYVTAIATIATHMPGATGR
jgi:integrase